MFFDGDERVIWFTEENGVPVLHYPDGKTVKSESNSADDSCSEGLRAHFLRARLYIQENEFWGWDTMAFNSYMHLIFYARPTSHSTYIFLSCHGAEDKLYPHLSPSDVALCKKNVDAFYADPLLQAGWHSLILYPVCLRVEKDSDKLTPVFIGDLGYTQTVIQPFIFDNVIRFEDLKKIFDPPVPDHKIIVFHNPREKYGFLSNWYKSSFYAEGKEFSSVEQYLMYHKAIMFYDDITASLIMQENDPKAIWELGRKASNFRDAEWAGRCQVPLYRGVKYKFTQSLDLRQKLLATGDDILVEGTSTDNRFANGLSRSDPNRFHMDKWPGQNLLGWTLMEVREELKREGQIKDPD